MLDIEEIMKILPHRYPFLLIDRVEQIENGESAIAYKNVTINEQFFQGHFPKQRVMPGVLIVEALAQTGAVAVLSEEENKGKLVYFAGINNLKFKRKVVPGDVLKLEVKIIKRKAHIGVGEAIATVNGEVACKGELTFAIG